MKKVLFFLVAVMMAGMSANAQTNNPTTPTGVVAVDLGLPSGTLWANMNVGATAPEDHGDYFAWGETTPQTDNQYSYVSYKWCYANNIDRLTKYCTNSSYGYNGFTDNKTILLAEDDAATANWGGNWCIPTKEQCDELINNTTKEWTRVNSVYGWIFKSKTNSNSIFLPCGGSFFDGNLCTDAESLGYYMTSTLNESQPRDAWGMGFYIGDVSVYYNMGRSGGVSVRPVQVAVNIDVNYLGKGTYCSEYPLDFTDVSGIEAYIVSGFKPSAGNLIVTRAYEVPAGTGLYIVGTPGTTYNIPVIETDFYYSNMMKGVLVETVIPANEGGYTNYVLSSDGHGGVIFKLSNNASSPANRAYVQIPSSTAGARKYLGIETDDGSTTGLDGVFTSDTEEAEGDYYNLNGQKVQTPQRGLYIKNGKKIIIH